MFRVFGIKSKLNIVNKTTTTKKRTTKKTNISILFLLKCYRQTNKTSIIQTDRQIDRETYKRTHEQM